MPSTQTDQLQQSLFFAFPVYNIPYSSLVFGQTLLAYLIDCPRVQPFALISQILQSNHQNISIVISSKNVLMRIYKIFRQGIANLVEILLGIEGLSQYIVECAFSTLVTERTLVFKIHIL